MSVIGVGGDSVGRTEGLISHLEAGELDDVAAEDALCRSAAVPDSEGDVLSLVCGGFCES